MAALYGNVECVRLLLDAGANVSCLMLLFRWTAAREASLFVGEQLPLFPPHVGFAVCLPCFSFVAPVAAVSGSYSFASS
jgi:hypothetical protein